MGALEQAHALEMITRWGNAAVLRRNGVDRACIAAELDFNPSPRNLELAGLRKFLLGAPLSPEPNHELDLLVANGEILRITLPVKGPRPDGQPVYYELTVEYQARV